MRSAIPWLTSLAVLLACGSARADGPADEAAAQALFDEGKRLMQDDRWAEACPKLEESHRLAPGIGTKFNLADCYEHTRRLASAWALFTDVAAVTRTKGQRDREELARARAAALEPRLSRLVVRVTARAPGLVVKRDGVVVGEAQWGIAVPVDAGSHVVSATADDRAPWQTSVVVDGEAKTERVDVPDLAHAGAVVVPPGAPTPVVVTQVAPPAPDGSTQRALAWVAGGAGVVALGAGAYFGLRSLSKHDDAQPHCAGDACDGTGLALRDQAIGAGNASTVAFAIGAAALAGAVVLFVTSPSPTTQLRASVGPGRATLGLAW